MPDDAASALAALRGPFTGPQCHSALGANSRAGSRARMQLELLTCDLNLQAPRVGSVGGGVSSEAGP